MFSTSSYVVTGTSMCQSNAATRRIKLYRSNKLWGTQNLLNYWPTENTELNISMKAVVLMFPWERCFSELTFLLSSPSTSYKLCAVATKQKHTTKTNATQQQEMFISAFAKRHFLLLLEVFFDCIFVTFISQYCQNEESFQKTAWLSDQLSVCVYRPIKMRLGNCIRMDWLQCSTNPDWGVDGWISADDFVVIFSQDTIVGIFIVFWGSKFYMARHERRNISEVTQPTPALLYQSCFQGRSCPN